MDTIGAKKQQNVVHRINRACSSWQYFHESLQRARQILEKNQYPPAFYEPIIKSTLQDILIPPQESSSVEPQQNGQTTTSTTIETNKTPKHMLMIQYRGKCTEAYARALHKIKAPCTVVMTLRKLKTLMPSIKPPVEKFLRSKIVYKITCPGCQACYVGQTVRHLQSRFREHQRQGTAITQHIDNCNMTEIKKLNMEDIEILASTHRGSTTLLTLEAIWIRELSPSINTKDEFRSRELTIRW